MAAGVERYRASNIVQPEDYDALEDGLYALAHAPVMPRSRRASPTCPSVCRRGGRRCPVPGGDGGPRPKRARSTSRWFALARDDDFVGVQNYERTYYGPDGTLPGATGRP